MSTTPTRTLRMTTEPAPHASGLRVEKKEQGIFAFIISALYRSRSLQAARILRQHQHLLAQSKDRIPHGLSQSSGGWEMLVASRPAQAGLAARPPSPNPMRRPMPVAAAVAFLAIHIIAGGIWLRASATETTTSRQEAEQWPNPFIQETNRSAGITPATDATSPSSLTTGEDRAKGSRNPLPTAIR
ncbi:hypothetical protein [Bradyrhizobium sp. CSS354]|uniref:hypothetical protein n=1 Tax=Bradyrhizobium sp. CSS354 TaxID=2699172 RepID=UPI0023B14075|nr:hypothetical protein [Bradyrhizobium sp. CSS354]MDE5462205.1 hypothetical protein [Bradyrhizobium sp. CSS354]